VSSVWIVFLAIAGAIAALVPNLSDGDRVEASAVIILCGVAAIYTQRREARKQEDAQAGRDGAFKRLSEDMTALVKSNERSRAGSHGPKTFEQEVGAILQNYTIEPRTGELKLTGFAPSVSITGAYGMPVIPDFTVKGKAP
jgi:hypothetical protein